MIQKTTWHPDTCGCVIEYEWDDSDSEDSRIHSVSDIIKACEVHDKYKNDKVKHFDSVMEENTLKNKVYSKLLEIPELIQNRLQDDGNTVKELKSGVKYIWSFNEDRKLEVEVTGIDISQKSLVLDKLGEFGIKVNLK